MESEVERVASKLIQFGKRGDIVFSVYVRKSVSGANEPFYILPFTKGRMRLRKGVYPMNLLRDLSIESIRTSHYFMMDIEHVVLACDWIWRFVEQPWRDSGVAVVLVPIRGRVELY